MGVLFPWGGIQYRCLSLSFFFKLSRSRRTFSSIVMHCIILYCIALCFILFDQMLDLIVNGNMLTLDAEQTDTNERWSGQFTSQYIEDITHKVHTCLHIDVFDGMYSPCPYITLSIHIHPSRRVTIRSSMCSVRCYRQPSVKIVTVF